MNLNRFSGKKLRGGLTGLSLLLCFALVFSVVFAAGGTAFVEAESVTSRGNCLPSLDGASGTFTDSTKVFTVAYDTGVDWTTGVTFNLDRDMTSYMTFVHTGDNPSASYKSDGSFSVGGYVTPVRYVAFALRFDFDSSLSTLAALGLLDVKISSSSSGSEQHVGAYFSDTPVATTSGTNDYAETLYNLSDDAACTNWTQVTNLNVAILFADKRNVGSFSSSFSNISVSFRINASRLSSTNYTYSGISMPCSSAYASLQAKCTGVAVSGLTYGAYNKSYSNKLFYDVYYVTVNGETSTMTGNGFVMDDTVLFSEDTSSGFNFSGTFNTLGGFSTIVDPTNSSKRIEKVTLQFTSSDGTISTSDLTLAESITAGYVKNTSTTTWVNSSPNVLSLDWTFLDFKGDIVVKVYNNAGKACTVNISITGDYDTSAPLAPIASEEMVAYSKTASDWALVDTPTAWFTSNTITGAFTVPALEGEGNAAVEYVYDLRYSNTSFNNISTPIFNANSSTIKRLAAETVVNNNNSNIDIVLSKSGYYGLMIAAIDAAGNASAISYYKFQADFTLPSFSVTFKDTSNSTYTAGEYSSKDINISFAINKSNQNPSSYEFYYYVGSTAPTSSSTWTSLGKDGGVPVKTFAIICADNSEVDSTYYFKAVTGAGNVYYLGQLDTYSAEELANYTGINSNQICIDKIAPADLTLDMFTLGESALSDFVYDEVTPVWITDSWDKTISFNYTDSHLANGVYVYYEIYDGDVRYINDVLELAATSGTANDVLLEMACSCDGGKRIVKLYIEDEAGNKSATLSFILTVDANDYEIETISVENAHAAGISLGTFDNADTYKRGDAFTIKAQPSNAARYIFYEAEVSYDDGANWVGVSPTLNSEWYEISGNIPSAIGADPSCVKVRTSYQIIVEFDFDSTAYVYTSERIVPTIGIKNYSDIGDTEEEKWNFVSSVADLIVNDAPVSYSQSIFPTNASTTKFEFADKDSTDDFYVTASQKWSMVVSPATLTVIPSVNTKVYGTADTGTFSATATGFQGEDTATLTIGRNAGEDVGNYAYDIDTVVITGTNASNYTCALVSSATEYTITRRSVKICLSYSSKTYDGNYVYVLANVADDSEYSALATDNEQFANLYFFVPDEDAGEHVDAVAVYKEGGTYNADISAKMPNYSISYDAQTFTIDQLTVNYVYAAASKIYGEADPELTLIADSTLIAVSDYSVSGLKRVEGEIVGTYDFDATNVVVEINNSNFKLGTVTVGTDKFSISKKEIAVSLSSSSVEYGTADYTVDYILTGALAADTAELTLSVSVATDVVGNVDLSITTGAIYDALNDNYTFDNAGAVIMVTKRAISVVATTTVFVTGSQVNKAALGLVFSNSLGSDTDAATVSFIGTDGVSNAEGVLAEGSYRLHIANLPDYYELDQYNIIIAVGDAKIVSIAFSTLSKTYDATALVLFDGVSYTMGGDAFTVDESAISIKVNGTPTALDDTTFTNAGSYNVVVTVLKEASGEEVGYYGYVEVTVVIQKAALTVTVITPTKVYGTTAESLAYSVSGLKGEDTVTGDITRTAGNDAGKYALDYSALVISSNYAVNYAHSDYEITKKTITVTPSVKTNVCYGDMNIPVSLDYTDEDGEAYIPVGTITGTIVPDADSATPAPGAYGFKVKTVFSADNYQIIVNLDTSFSIYRKSIKVLAEDVSVSSKEYDGDASVKNFSVDISAYRIGADDVVINENDCLALFSSTEVGYRSVTISGLIDALWGDDKDKYTIENDTVTVQNISILAINWVIGSDGFYYVSGDKLTDKVYDGSNVLSLDVADILTGDSYATSVPSSIFNKFDLADVYVGGRYDDKNVGNDKAVEIYFDFDFDGSKYSDNLSVSSTDSKYEIQSKSNGTVLRIVYKLTGNIIRKDLTLKFTGVQPKVYDGTTSASIIYNWVGYVSGDSISLSDGESLAYSAYFADADAGENKAVTLNFYDVIYGLDKDNYNLVNVIMPDDLTGTITPYVLYINLSVDNKIYDGTDSAKIHQQLNDEANWDFTRMNGLGGNNTEFVNDFVLYFNWNANVVATFNDKNVAFDNYGNIVPVDVAVSGIQLVLADTAPNTEGWFNLSNYTIYGVTDGIYDGIKATISPKSVQCNSDKIFLDNKFYDKTTSGTITLADNCLTGILAGDNMVTLDYTVVWETADVSTSANAMITIKGLSDTDSDSVNTYKNYSLSPISLTRYGAIKPAAVSIDTVTISDKIYDATPDAKVSYYSISGVISGDDVDIVFGSVKFSDGEGNVEVDAFGNPKQKSVIIKNITLTGSSKSNYSLYEGSTAVDVITELSDEYDTKAKIIPYELILNNSHIKVKDITYKLMYDMRTTEAEKESDRIIPSNNYSISGYTLPLAETASLNIKVESATYKTLCAGSNLACTFVIKGVYNAADQINYNYVLRGRDSNNNNYLTLPAAANIKKAQVDVSVENMVVEYGTPSLGLYALNYTIDGVKIGNVAQTGYNNEYNYNNMLDTLLSVMKTKISVTTAYTSTTSVGELPVRLEDGTASNYDFITNNGKLTVTAATLNVTTDNVTVVKGNAVKLGTVYITGYKNGETASVLKVVPKATTTATHASATGVYAITFTEGQATNYVFTYATDKVVNIVQGKIEGSSWNDVVYSLFTATNSYKYIKTTSYTGLMISMDVNVSNPSYVVSYKYYKTPDLSDSPYTEGVSAVGVYYVVATISGEGFSSQVMDDGVLIINKAKPSLTVPSKTEVVYDGTPKTVTPSINIAGLKVTVYYGDSGSTTAPTESGTYKVYAKYVGGNDSNYYDVTSAAGELVIQAAKVYVTIEKEMFTYEENAQRRIIYSVADLPEDIYIIETYTQGSLTPFVYNNKPDIGGEAPVDVGEYRYELTLSDHTNYEIVASGSTNYLKIGQKSISTKEGNVNCIVSTGFLDETYIPANSYLVTQNMGSNYDNLSTEAQIIWTIASNKLGDNCEILNYTSVVLRKEDGDSYIDSTAFDGDITVALALPVGVSAGKNLKVYRVDGDVLTDMNATFVDGQAVFTTAQLGDFIFIEENTVDISLYYAIIGGAGLLIVITLMVIGIKRAAVIRNMRALIKAKTGDE